MPVYNTPPALLDAAMESVLRQRAVDFELIVVDDGSDAATASMVDSWASRDSRILATHTGNRGLASARNHGLTLAKGRHVCFVDSDDMLFDDALAVLTEIRSSSGCPIAMGRFTSKEPGKARLRPFITLSAEAAIEACLYQQGGIQPSACGKLYDRGLFDRERFADGIYYEDLDFFYRAALAAGRVAYTDSAVYFYRMHPASFLHTWRPERADVLDVTERMQLRLEPLSPALGRAARDRRMSAAFNIFIEASRHGDTALARRCWQIAKPLRKESLLNGKVRIKNKLGAALSLCGPRVFSSVAIWLGM